MTSLTPDRIVLGHSLTEAQQAFLLVLPPDGSWKSTREGDLNRYGPNALRGFGKSGLIEGYYQEEMRHRLTPEGERVAERLRSILSTEEARKALTPVSKGDEM